jgi:predicted methyltransferase
MKLTRKLSAALLVLILGSAQSVLADNHDAALQAAINDRSAEDRSRDEPRQPEKTLKFFMVKPGMVVAEGLPGGGWYSKILANYLGSDGALYGVNYADRMWPMFSWAREEFVAERIAATAKFPELVATFTDNGITARGFTFESVPKDVVGTVDRVLLIRALHNLNRFEAKEGTRTAALKAVHSMLKDDGLVGVVQHRAPESVSDESAQGQRGYLKQSAVINMFEEAGFELFASTEINANHKDQPGETSVVWRLSPSLRGSENDKEKGAAMQAIGESDRMTLLFSKALVQ